MSIKGIWRYPSFSMLSAEVYLPQMSRRRLQGSTLDVEYQVHNIWDGSGFLRIEYHVTPRLPASFQSSQTWWSGSSFGSGSRRDEWTCDKKALPRTQHGHRKAVRSFPTMLTPTCRFLALLIWFPWTITSSVSLNGRLPNVLNNIKILSIAVILYSIVSDDASSYRKSTFVF